MRLQKLIVKNFRGIGTDEAGNGAELVFDNNNLIFICGENNCGKSSFLHAYEMLVLAANKAVKSDFYQEAIENPIQIEAWVIAESAEDRAHRALARLWDENGLAKVRKTWTEFDGVGNKESYDPENGWQQGGAGGFDTLLQNALPKPIWIRGATTPEEVITLLQTLVQETILKQVAQRPVYQEALDAVTRLEQAIREDEYTGSLQSHLNDAISHVFPAVSFRLKNEGERDITDLFKRQTSITISELGRPELGFMHHGHGVRRQFIVSAFRGLASQLEEAKKTPKQRKEENFVLDDLAPVEGRSKSKMLLIEEPELFLHPEAIRSVRDLIYYLGSTSDFQILAATHAPIMVDLSKPHTTLARAERRPDGSIQLNQVSSDLFDADERDRMKMLNYFDPYVCEAFFTNFALLVEGDTECVALRRLTARMAETPEHQAIAGLHIVNCGTKNNIPFFQKVLTHFRIPYWVFHDLDARLNGAGNINSAWTLNQRIWDQIQASRQSGISANRCVFNAEFESGNGYEHDPAIGKPFSAYLEAGRWNITDETKSAVKFLRVIAGASNLDQEFTPEFLERLVQ